MNTNVVFQLPLRVLSRGCIAALDQGLLEGAQPWALQATRDYMQGFQKRKSKDRRGQLKKAKATTPDLQEFGPPRGLISKLKNSYGIDLAALSAPEPAAPVAQPAPAEAAAAPEASTSAPAAESAEKKSWVPSWLKFLVPGSDKDKAKEKADAKKPEEDIWKGLDQAANMGVDEYALFCQQQLTAKPPPPIKTPERDWRSMQVKPDSDRIYYQRTTQHARIAQSMNDAQKATVKADVSAALKNRELLRAVAAQSGFIVPEVADCLRTLDNVRKSNQRLLAWQASGRPMPKGREEIARVMAKVRREEGDADWRRLRAACDPQNCPVVRKQGVLTPAVVCTLTRLPYYRCCGAAARRAAPKALPAAAASAAAPAPAPAS